MERIMPADIRDLIDCDRDLARNLARKCNTIAHQSNVSAWELSYESFGAATRVLYLDGWTLDGSPACHSKISAF